MKANYISWCKTRCSWSSDSIFKPTSELTTDVGVYMRQCWWKTTKHMIQA